MNSTALTKPELSLLMFVMGGALTGFLTLGIIASTRHDDPEILAREFSRLSIAFTAMSALGPLITGYLVGAFGGDAVMIFGSSAAGLLFAFVMAVRML
jgi:hypothetical protein